MLQFKGFRKNLILESTLAITSPTNPFWNRPLADLFVQNESAPQGITSEQAKQKLNSYGFNALSKKKKNSAFNFFISQFKNPLVLILLFAVVISAFLHEWIDATIITIIVFGSAILTFIQEYSASNSIEKLQAQVQIRCTVLRDGQEKTISAEEVVPGDVVKLSAGSLIPADGILIDAVDFFVNQAVLTGETFPVEKFPGVVPENASIAERSNCVYMGTSVGSGFATALIINTGQKSIFGGIAANLNLRPPETNFERGIRQFGYLLSQIMMLMVLVVFAAKMFLHHPVIDSLLFAIALAVGLSPEMLPAIISITLAKGAQEMAKQGVIVRRLNSIENFGSMDVLCTDKTGTITEGVVSLDQVLDVEGKDNQQILLYAALNASNQTGLVNPLDEAIVKRANIEKLDLSQYEKKDEIPFDFKRKRLSIIVQRGNESPLFISKGALDPILSVCTKANLGGDLVALDEKQLTSIQQKFEEWSKKGYRVLGIASKVAEPKTVYRVEDEADLIFNGFLLFFDPPKKDANQAIKDLAGLGVTLKIITGDNHLVANHIAEQVGIDVDLIITGSALNTMSEEALMRVADQADIFAEVDPNQKERIILALKKLGHVVGYMGDGINDASALQAADVGLSVDTAVDVAKQAADFVLLENDLGVLQHGIENGRTTFSNTMKYVMTTTSANFGNMFSMAGASLILPFLPLLAKQILLNNFLSDLPSITIASDNVDHDMMVKPHRWDIKFIRNFMIVFGLTSSIFDYLTFFTLLYVIKSAEAQFQTGWFIESLLTELAITLIVRTRSSIFKSKPSRLLAFSTLGVTVLAIVIPYLPFSKYFGFVPLPLWLLLVILGITLTYAIASEIVKHFFYKRYLAKAK
jgi:Mg2+-importing ATPase